MARANHRRPISAAGDGRHRGALHLSILLLLFSTRCAAQPSSSANNNSNNNNNDGFGAANFSPSMAIVIVVLVSAFFFLGFFSIYIRQCGGETFEGRGSIRGGGRSRRQRGLDPAVLATFPTMVYSDVKVHRIGKGALECAVCLSEFENDEELRLLPKCSHAFHPDCIDAWLANHVTCPVCRANLEPGSDPASADDPETQAMTAAAGVSAVVPAPEAPDLDPPPPAAVAVPIQEEERRGRPPDHVEIDVERHEEMIDLQRIASKRRGGEGSRSKRLRRSHSTGHSVALQPGESMDRFTLRLPDHVRREIVAAGRLRRTTSLVALPTALEGSSHRGYRAAGEGSSRGGRSIRLGRSDRWPSFLLRTLSARIPAWGAGRRGAGASDGEGSVRKTAGDSEGSTRGRLASPFECLGVGGKADADAAAATAASDDDSTARRVVV